MKGLETACKKDKFVIALVTTFLEGDWRSSQIVPSAPKSSCWLPGTCAGAQLERGDDIDPAPKLCVSKCMKCHIPLPKHPELISPCGTKLLLLPEPAGVPLLGATQTQSGENKSAQLKHPGLAMAKKSITQVMILRKNHFISSMENIQRRSRCQKIKSFFYNPLDRVPMEKNEG